MYQTESHFRNSTNLSFGITWQTHMARIQSFSAQSSAQNWRICNFSGSFPKIKQNWICLLKGQSRLSKFGNQQQCGRRLIEIFRIEADYSGHYRSVEAESLASDTCNRIVFCERTSKVSSHDFRFSLQREFKSPHCHNILSLSQEWLHSIGNAPASRLLSFKASAFFRTRLKHTTQRHHWTKRSLPCPWLNN